MIQQDKQLSVFPAFFKVENEVAAVFGNGDEAYAKARLLKNTRRASSPMPMLRKPITLPSSPQTPSSRSPSLLILHRWTARGWSSPQRARALSTVRS